MKRRCSITSFFVFISVAFIVAEAKTEILPEVSMIPSATLEIESKDSLKVVLSAVSPTAFQLRVENCTEEVHHVAWNEKKERRRYGSMVVTPTNGTFEANFPEAPGAMSITITALSKMESDVCSALGITLTHEIGQLNMLGDYFRTEAKPELGLVEYDRIIREFPEDGLITPKAFVGKAICLRNLKRYKDALDTCDEIVGKYGTDPSVLGGSDVPLSFWSTAAANSEKGLVYEWQQKWKEALIVYRDDLEYHRKQLPEDSYPPTDWRSKYVSVRDEVIPEKIARMELLVSPDLAVQKIDPPESDFFSKKIVYNGIPIKSHAVVDDRALQEAANRLISQLGRIPDVANNLVQAGAELHIIGEWQNTSDLPYLREWKGKPYDGDLTIDERTRGVGGLFASCGEENLLRLPSDRYREHRDICRHEFAHTIHGNAVDEECRAMLEEQYKKSIDKGLWKNMYAGSNTGEYIAELTMWYFNTRGDTGRLGNTNPPSTEGPLWLKSYDPEGYDLLDRFYSGKIPIKRIENKILPAHSKDEESNLKSTSDGKRTRIVFKNETDKKYSLYRLDSEGKREAQGTVDPHSRETKRARAGQVWLVEDTAGNIVALYVAEEERGTAVLE